MIDERSFSVRYRERLEREHLAKRTTLASEVAQLQLRRAENLVDGVWLPGDVELEAALARLATLDQNWAADALSWDEAMRESRRIRAGWDAARERAGDPAFVAAVGELLREESLR